MKWSENRGKAIKKAMPVLGMIKRIFDVIDCHTSKILYKTYVHPQLEYCIQACSPYFKKDINCLERVQQRATTLVRSLRKLPY